MKFGEFMVQLKKGVPHVLLLAGEERYYIDRALEAVLARLFPDGGQRDGLTKLTGDVDGDQLIGLLETVPFLIPQNVVVVEDTTLFRTSKKSAEAGGDGGAGAEAAEAAGGTKRGKGAKSSADKKLERLQAELLAMPDFSYVIFVMGEKPDKRKKLTKTVEKAGLVLEA